MKASQARHIRVRFIRHSTIRQIGLVSDDLPGLILWGTDENTLLADAPMAAAQLLNADYPNGAPWKVEATL